MNEEEILEIAKKDGNQLNFKVADLLTSREWKADTSCHYADLITGKKRELDVMAVKKIPRTELVVKLFIECKYLGKNTVFTFMDKDANRAEELAMDNNILRDKDPINLRNSSQLPIKEHHYLTGSRVAKAWQTKDQKDYIHEAVDGVLHSLIYYTSHFNDDFYTITLPIVVLNSFNFVYKIEDGKPIRINENFILERDYSYPFKSNGKHKRQFFFIDVVDFTKLNEFLDILDNNDIYIIKNILLWDLRRSAMQSQRHNEYNDYGLLDPYE